MKTESAIAVTPWLLAVVLCMVSALAMALDVKSAGYLAYGDVDHAGETVRIQRVQDQDNILADGFAKTSCKRPSFCIQPMSVAPGVATVGEAEIFRFMERRHAAGTGMIVDARTPAWHAKGTIPGSVNIPFTRFAGSDEDPETIAVMGKVGASVVVKPDG